MQWILSTAFILVVGLSLFSRYRSSDNSGPDDDAIVIASVGVYTFSKVLVLTIKFQLVNQVSTVYGT